MAKDGDDKHGLQKTNLKKFSLNFSKCTDRDGVPLQRLRSFMIFDHNWKKKLL